MITDSIYNDQKATTAAITISYMQSAGFHIATNSIFELLYKINGWMLSGVCGAMIYGRSRIGKTSAIAYIVDALHVRYGENFPILVWSLTEHGSKVTDKSFYAGILNVLGIDIGKYNRITALELKIKVINYFAIKAAETPFNKAIMIIDEAYKLDEAEYYWLMDIYNTLRLQHQIQLSIFFVGTPREMICTRDSFILQKKDQIVERFFINEYRFSGIKSCEELAYCLSELDKTKVHEALPIDSNVGLVEFFFPYAYVDSKATFLSIAEEYWEAFNEVKFKYAINFDDIPMQYFMQSFLQCLISYGTGSLNPKYFLHKNDITLAIEETGYGRINSDE
ncbi:ATP-binding protein [Butyrivibrio sp. JL13D10]|uniref:ATP-binding protein n=1 Tax=Butyrivibrio sp. JL13D10 TaxID=3236815 RepID=UPI0038B5192B